MVLADARPRAAGKPGGGVTDTTRCPLPADLAGDRLHLYRTYRRVSPRLMAQLCGITVGQLLNDFHRGALPYGVGHREYRRGLVFDVNRTYDHYAATDKAVAA